MQYSRNNRYIFAYVNKSRQCRDIRQSVNIRYAVIDVGNTIQICPLSIFSQKILSTSTRGFICTHIIYSKDRLLFLPLFIPLLPVPTVVLRYPTTQLLAPAKVIKKVRKDKYQNDKWNYCTFESVYGTIGYGTRIGNDSGVGRHDFDVCGIHCRNGDRSS